MSRWKWLGRWGTRAAVVMLLAAGCTPTVPVVPGSKATVTVGGRVVTVSVPTGMTVTVKAAQPSTLPPYPADLEFPVGALAVGVQNVPIGSVVHITIALPEAVSDFQKLVDGAWDPFTFDGTTGGSLSADGRTLTLDIRDGGRGDADHVDDGAIVDPILVTNASTAVPAFVGIPYSRTLVATGGTALYSWSIAGGALAAGLSLSPTGVIAGTPSAESRLPVSIRVTDAAARTTTQAVSANVFTASPQAEAPASAGNALPGGGALIFSHGPGFDVDRNGNAPMNPALAQMRADGTIERVATIGGNPSVTVGTNAPIGVGGSKFDPKLRWRVTVTPPSPAMGPFPDQTVTFTAVDTGAVAATLPDHFPVGTWQFSPDGNAFAISNRVTGVVWVYDASSAGGLSVLPGFGGPSGMPGRFVLGPNGLLRQGAYATSDGVQVMQTALGGPKVLVGAGSCSPLAWSVQGRIAARCQTTTSVGVTETLWTVNAADDTNRVNVFSGYSSCTSGPTGPSPLCTPRLAVSAAVFSPDGTRLAVSSSAGPTSLMFPLSIGERIRVYNDQASATPVDITSLRAVPGVPVAVGSISSFDTPLAWIANPATPAPPVSGAAPAITTSSLPIAVVGAQLTATLTATGQAPLTWRMKSIITGVGDPITINPTTGVTSGTVSVNTGPTMVMAVATDASGRSAGRFYLIGWRVNLSVGEQPVTTAGALPDTGSIVISHYPSGGGSWSTWQREGTQLKSVVSVVAGLAPTRANGFAADDSFYVGPSTAGSAALSPFNAFNSIALPTSATSAVRVMPSPDSSKVAVVGTNAAGGVVVKVFRSTGVAIGEIVLTPAATGPYPYVVWKPNGTELFVGTERNPTDKVLSVGTSSLSVAREVTLPASYCYVSDWSVTDRLVAGCGDGTVKTFSAQDGGTVRTVFPLAYGGSFSPTGTRLAATTIAGAVVTAPDANGATATPLTTVIAGSPASYDEVLDWVDTRLPTG